MHGEEGRVPWKPGENSPFPWQPSPAWECRSLRAGGPPLRSSGTGPTPLDLGRPPLCPIMPKPGPVILSFAASQIIPEVRGLKQHHVRPHSLLAHGERAWGWLTGQRSAMSAHTETERVEAGNGRRSLTFRRSRWLHTSTHRGCPNVQTHLKKGDLYANCDTQHVPIAGGTQATFNVAVTRGAQSGPRQYSCNT